MTKNHYTKVVSAKVEDLLCGEWGNLGVLKSEGITQINKHFSRCFDI